MDYQTIIYETHGAVAKVTTNRPRYKHAFSSGHDIGTPEERADMRARSFPPGLRGEYALSRQLFLDTTLRWRSLEKPTIAQVQGM